MQFASDRWLHFHKNLTVGISGLIALACLVGWFVPGASWLVQSAGLSYLTFCLALVHLGYGLFLYKYYERRSGAWMASLIGASLFILNIINLVHVTGQLQSPWLALWAVICFMGAVFGGATGIIPAFIITLYFVLLQSGPVGQGGVPADLQPLDIGAVLVSYLLCFVGWVVWRRTYIDTNTSQVKHLAGQLKNRQQMTEMLIQSIGDGIIVIDTDSKVMIMNPAASIMTEWGLDEVVGIDVRLVTKFFQEDGKDLDENADPFTSIFAQGETLNTTLQLVGRSGKKQIVSLVVSPVKQPDSDAVAGAVAVMRDVSAAKAEEARRADFISTASHEMRTPVAAIEGYLALALNDKVSQIDAKARSFIMKAHSSTQHLGKLFQDLLTSAKAEDGRLVSNPSVIEMGEYIEQLTDTLKFTAEKKGLLVDFTIGASGSGGAGGVNKVVRPLYYIHADPDRLREVITNLFDNAVKYTEKGKVSLGLTGNESVVQVFVRDTGPGIPTEDIPHLFQKFYRVDNSATRTIGGTGLGLFICRKIIELYGGRIWVESEVDKGSTFYINIPRLTTQKASDMKKAEAQAPPSV